MTAKSICKTVAIVPFASGMQGFNFKTDLNLILQLEPVESLFKDGWLVLSMVLNKLTHAYINFTLPFLTASYPKDCFLKIKSTFLFTDSVWSYHYQIAIKSTHDHLRGSISNVRLLVTSFGQMSVRDFLPLYLPYALSQRSYKVLELFLVVFLHEDSKQV